MPIVTLTTDLGKDTHQVAKVKMQLLRALPSAHIIDISHSITPYAIDEAAYLLDSTLDDFPEGTVHIVAVDADLPRYQRLLAANYKGQYILAADNGFLTLLTGGENAQYFEWPIDKSAKDIFFPLKQVLIPAAIKLTLVGEKALGPAVENILEKTLEKPLLEEEGLKGQVVYVNNYHNAVTNITRAVFDKERFGRNFKIVLNRFDNINTISRNYEEVAEGKSLCFFNENGLLEIAINRGKASQLLGLERGKFVTVMFFNDEETGKSRQGSLLE